MGLGWGWNLHINVNCTQGAFEALPNCYTRVASNARVYRPTATELDDPLCTRSLTAKLSADIFTYTTSSDRLTVTVIRVTRRKKNKDFSLCAGKLRLPFSWHLLDWLVVSDDWVSERIDKRPTCNGPASARSRGIDLQRSFSPEIGLCKICGTTCGICRNMR